MKFLNKILNLMIAFGLVVYGAFLFFNKKTQLAPVQQIDQSSIDVDKVVNKYMQQTSEKILQDQQASKRAVELALKQPLKLNPTSEKPVVELGRDQQIHKASEVAKPTSLRPDPPSDTIDKKEYARQFIENARKGGYHIELNDDLEVQTVTPIRNPSGIDATEILPSN